MQNKEIPIMSMGKYRGLKIDQLPNSYLRWMLSQDFPKEWKDIAKEKLGSSQFDNTTIDISRHAYDMFSIRYLDKWNEREDKKMGMATFLARLANDAIEKGKDVSKKRRNDDGQIFEYQGIKFVVSKIELIRTLITVM